MYIVLITFSCMFQVTTVHVRNPNYKFTVGKCGYFNSSPKHSNQKFTGVLFLEGRGERSALSALFLHRLFLYEDLNYNFLFHKV